MQRPSSPRRELGKARHRSPFLSSICSTRIRSIRKAEPVLLVVHLSKVAPLPLLPPLVDRPLSTNDTRRGARDCDSYLLGVTTSALLATGLGEHFYGMLAYHCGCGRGGGAGCGARRPKQKNQGHSRVAPNPALGVARRLSKENTR